MPWRVSRVLMDRRVTLEFYEQGEPNAFYEPGPDRVTKEKTIWAHRRTDSLVEKETTNRGHLEFVVTGRREYVIRPLPELKAFADQHAYDRIHLIEDGESWFLRGVVEEGRNRFWVIECERLGAS